MPTLEFSRDVMGHTMVMELDRLKSMLLTTTAGRLCRLLIVLWFSRSQV
jgi:hypothetical protein